MTRHQPLGLCWILEICEDVAATVHAERPVSPGPMARPHGTPFVKVQIRYAGETFSLSLVELSPLRRAKSYTLLFGEWFQLLEHILRLRGLFFSWGSFERNAVGSVPLEIKAQGITSFGSFLSGFAAGALDPGFEHKPEKFTCQFAAKNLFLRNFKKIYETVEKNLRF